MHQSVPATRGDILDLRLDLRELANSFRGLGIGLTTMAQQNKELVTAFRDSVSTKNDGRRASGRVSRRHDSASASKSADRDSMEVDEGDEADDDEAPPPPQPTRRVPIKKTGLPQRRDPEENALKVRNS